MSTQQILTVVGTVVGAYFGYPQLGFVVGSLVGAALTPKTKIEGPRIDDQKVTVSTYGGGIPTIYGAARVGGNIIFSTNKIERGTTTEEGKGGGVENTTYQYFVHMAIALCVGPIVGIRKVWRDGKLIYDASVDASINSALASAASPFSNAILYLGTEDQMPDPTQEIYLGAGNVPAYRGLAYIQMNDIECPGGRVPQFSLEVISAGEVGAQSDLGDTTPVPHDPTWAGGRRYSRVGEWGGPTIVFYDNSIDLGDPLFRKVVGVYSVGNGYATPLNSWQPGDQVYNYYCIDGVADIDACCFRQVTASTYVDQGHNIVLLADGSSKRFFLDDILCFGQTSSRWAKRGNRIAFTGDANHLDWNVALFDWETLGLIGRTTRDAAASDVMLHITSNYTWLAIIGPGGASGVDIALHSNEDFSLISTTSLPDEFFEDGTTYFAAGDNDVLYAWNQFTTRSDLWAITESAGVLSYRLVGSAAPADSLTPVSPYGGISVSGATVTGLVLTGAFGVDNWNLFMVRFNVNTPEAASVADIIEKQCMRAGLTAGQVDVSTITDVVEGYTVTNPASARSNIQPLLTAYAIDAAEEDGKVKFFKRAAVASVATIAYAELGCVEGDAEPIDPMPLSRAQEAELPRSVIVSYINTSFDYQTAAEPSQRQVTESQHDQNVELPISTNSDHAASVAQMVLYDAWNERNKRSLKVSRKYAYVSAGDGVTVEYPQGTFLLWRLTQATDTGALCEWEVVPADESIYTQTAIGAAEYTPQTVDGLPPPTRMQIVDSAILRDADNNAGVYVALSGYTTGYPGGELFIGDDATTLTPRGTVANEAPIGLAETALGDWSTNVVDEVNLLTVNVGHHALSSITRSVLITGTSNVAAIGAAGRWEIIKFQRADYLGDGRYTLSGLLRGQRGTEWAAGLHAAGDTFVLLAMAGMLRPNFDNGSIGQTQTYKAVTTGLPAASAASSVYASTGEGLECFSPVDLRRAPSGSDIILSWHRRTRLSENVLTGIFPLGESVESYELDLFTDNTYGVLLRTFSSSTESVTYTAAMQAVDGYSSGPIYARVYQMSGVVGRGHELEATV